jgi:hypothetical protein
MTGVSDFIGATGGVTAKLNANIVEQCTNKKGIMSCFWKPLLELWSRKSLRQSFYAERKILPSKASSRSN